MLNTFSSQEGIKCVTWIGWVGGRLEIPGCSGGVGDFVVGIYLE